MLAKLGVEAVKASGQLAIDCGVLERELERYLERLTSKRPSGTLGPKIGSLRMTLTSQRLTRGAMHDFIATLDALDRLVDIRNAALKRAWKRDPSGGYTVMTRHHRSVRHIELPLAAAQLRDAKKLLLHLMHDHLPGAAGKRRPVTPAALLAARLSISLSP